MPVKKFAAADRAQVCRWHRISLTTQLPHVEQVGAEEVKAGEAEADRRRYMDPLAKEWWEKAAELGVPEAQYNLAAVYQSASGGAEQNYTKAIDLYKKAAKGDHAGAQYNLGFMYEHGQGVEKNYIGASYEMLDSRWAKQTPNRAKAMAKTMKEIT